MSDTRWEQILRYRFIEIIALWEGRLTTDIYARSLASADNKPAKTLTTTNALLVRQILNMTPPRRDIARPLSLRRGSV